MFPYRCTQCHSTELSWYKKKIECKSCNCHFPQSDEIFDFSLGDEEKENQRVKYNETITEKYRNFLNWLYLTFRIDEKSFRATILQGIEIPTEANILVIGIGLGHDVDFLINEVGRTDLNFHCQDLSLQMLAGAKVFLEEKGIVKYEMNCSNASNLPYIDNYFDFVFHFGGINYFQDKKRAINEMNRVARDGAQILIGDESVAPWLRDKEFGKMMIVNNPLWSAEPPTSDLPSNANSVLLKYIFENCFYILSWKKNSKFPNVDLDIKHIGPRGGTIRKRFYGELEGVDPALARVSRKIAKDAGLDYVTFLENAIQKEVKEIVTGSGSLQDYTETRSLGKGPI